MASPQPDKYTRISNEFLDALCLVRINGEARQVLDAIIRKTWGFNKKSDEISTSQLMQMTGLYKKSVERARAKLLELNIITADKIEGCKFLVYSVQKDYEKWSTAVNFEGISTKSGTPENDPKLRSNFSQSAVNSDPKVRSKSQYSNTKDTTKDKQKTKDSISLASEIKSLKALDWDDQKIKEHFLMRKIPEVQIDIALGKLF